MNEQEIIDKAVEKTLLMIPEVVGNLMKQTAAYSMINSKFYKDHPEFKDKKDIVASVVEMIDGENPALEYDELLNRAIPKIKERIEITKNMDVKTVPTHLNRDFGNGEV